MRSPPRLHASRIKYHACESKEHHGGEEGEVTGGSVAVLETLPPAKKARRRLQTGLHAVRAPRTRPYYPRLCLREQGKE